jgi:hypothetical protein
MSRAALAGRSFSFVGQAHAGLVPDEGSLLVLDTNVVSALHSVARRGIDLERPTDQRVAHLLLWLHDRPSAAVFHVFGIAEGAGFHRGALEHHALMERGCSSLAVIEHGRIHGEEWVSSGEPLPNMWMPSEAISPRNVTEVIETLLPLTVLPCYVAALAAALADRRGQQPLEAATSVFRRLVAEIDYVPLFGWLASALLFLGKPTLRRDLRQELFKFQRPDLRLSCLSAAWDLGYLQLLSLIRSPLLSGFFEARMPILVTEDGRLAPTAVLAPCFSNTPAFEVSGDLLDSAFEEEALALVQACTEERLAGGTIPEWDGCNAATASLEEELELEATPFAPTAATLVVKLGRDEIGAFVELLRFDSVNEIINRYDHLDPKIEFAGLEVVAGLLGDNARARGRLVEESLRVVLAKPLTEAESPSTILVSVLNMVSACLRDDSQMTSAWGQKLIVGGHEGWIWPCLWWFGRKVLEDTAVARGDSIETLVSRLYQRCGSEARASA